MINQTISHYKILEKLGQGGIYCKLGKVEEAIDYLESSLQTGYASKAWAETDPDFEPIRGHPRFQRILKKLE